MAKVVRAVERGNTYIFEVCPDDECSHDAQAQASFHRTHTWGTGRVEGMTPEGDERDDTMSIDDMLREIAALEEAGPVQIVLDDVVGRVLKPDGR